MTTKKTTKSFEQISDLCEALQNLSESCNELDSVLEEYLNLEANEKEDFWNGTVAPAMDEVILHSDNIADSVANLD